MNTPRLARLALDCCLLLVAVHLSDDVGSRAYLQLYGMLGKRHNVGTCGGCFEDKLLLK